MKIHRILILFLLGTIMLFAGSDWQNSVDFKIKVKLDDEKHILSGEETLKYYNNSPTPLSRIWLLLYPNAYKDETTAFAKQGKRNFSTIFHFSKEKDRGYIDFEFVTVNDDTVNITSPPDSIDVGYIDLTDPLLPGDSISIYMSWTVKIPKIFSRFGHVDQHYEMVQWFPKVAVFDENGWHPYPYLDQGEFYYEFGTFDVEITLPDEYVVGATGQLISPESEILKIDSLAEIGNRLMNLPKKEMKKEFKKITKSVKKEKKKKKKEKEIKKSFKTLRYVAKDVHDFAWIADKEFYVQKGFYKYPDEQDSIAIWNLFLPRNYKPWIHTIKTVQNTLEIYGSIIGPYPYPNVWVIESTLMAGGGMEYPMLTLIVPIKNIFIIEMIIAHEVGHNWFYGILGFDEREHGWMDEGINTWAEHRYIEKYIPETEQNILPKKFRFLLKDFNHLYMSRILLDLTTNKNQDLPSHLSAEKYPFLQYAASIYYKPALGLRFLESYIGREKFDGAMREFYNDWKYQHPKPIDMELSFEESLGENLDWFFHDFLKTIKKVDHKITDFSTKPDNDKWKTNIKVENSGDLKVPVQLALFDKNKKLVNRWIFPNDDELKYTITTDYRPTRVVLDPNLLTTDIDFSNNSNRLPIDLDPFVNVSKPDKFHVFYSPLIGFDYMDGFHAGMALFRGNITPLKHNFFITSSYTWKSKNPLWSTGYGNTIYDKIGTEFKYGFKAGESTGKRLYTISASVIQYPKFWGTHKHTFDIKGEYLDIFYDDFYDSTYWDIGNFTNVITSWNYSKRWFLSRFNTEAKLKIGSNVTGTNGLSKYAKVTFESSYSYRLNRKQRIQLRLFVGSFLKAYKNLPKQEYFYANGGIDPSFEDRFVLDRSGKTDSTPMNYYYISDGINLKGYPGLSGNFQSAGFNVKYRFSNLFAFFDIGDVLNESEKFAGHFDFGIGLRFGPLNFYLPLYLNRPVDGYDKLSDFDALKYRWLIQIDLKSISIKIG
ncbi:MAG: hypothetical protein ISS81_05470 [Candidatus Marinimicrobia bacterium]|nr:hypothetical protein [Candidatus Neomarinimicrobiota bacterium]